MTGDVVAQVVAAALPLVVPVIKRLVPERRAQSRYNGLTLEEIERMPQNTLEEIRAWQKAVDAYTRRNRS